MCKFSTSPNPIQYVSMHGYSAKADIIYKCI